MAQPFITRSVHAALLRYLRERPDLGVRKALAEAFLEARNPFEPEAVRPLRPWVVLFAVLLTCLLAAFLGFGNLR